MNSVAILYIAVLISTHQSAVETITSVLVLVMHDFTQHAIITSHKNGAMVSDALKHRMLLSAFAGVQLLLLNLCIAYITFFGPLITLYEGILSEWSGKAIQIENPVAIVLRTLSKMYLHDCLQGSEVVIGVLSVIPTSVVLTGVYWLGGISYGNMSFRPGIHRSRIERLRVDDILANAVVSAIALLTGQHMFRMVESLLTKKLFGFGVAYTGDLVESKKSHGGQEVLINTFISVYDLLATVCSQALMGVGIVKTELFGRRAMRRTMFTVLTAESLFGILRIGLLVGWDGWWKTVVCFVTASVALRIACAEVWDRVAEVRMMERRRERALRR